MSTPLPPCRLYCILARRAEMGVIFRRGPSDWVQIIRWDTGQDTFDPGQWFHGRIYEHRCDLSPTGRLMIYFARKINRRTLEDREYTYAWTAVSRPPYLTALALWPKGDCWHGGGLFENSTKVWLNHRPDAAKPHPNHRPLRLKVVDNPHACGEDGPVLFRRLKRDGWILRQDWEIRQEGGRYIAVKPMLHEKPCPTRPLVLTMASSLKGRWLEEEVTFTLRHERGDIVLAGAEWADWDQRGRLVFFRAGKVFAGSIDDTGDLTEVELADFNSARPENKKAPTWATRW